MSLDRLYFLIPWRNFGGSARFRVDVGVKERSVGINCVVFYLVLIWDNY